ncbi:glycoside hydrolase family protein [Helicobacter pylori]|uniref:glycoside hydrolase family protein n=1 Tax=Helicobacter pylori TaxID=210 RepID=UPI002DDB15D4|nr:glycoside hydrolase family protein [Helicobacter pylori]
MILAASFLIVDSEGFSPSIYTDKTGHPTIGYGYNLSVYFYEGKRITKPQAYGLLTDILKENHKTLLSYGWYKNLDAMRRMVILDLSYNLGLSGLLKFKQFIKAIEDKNYALAVERLQKSPYFNQVRKRASRNMEVLKLGGCEKHCKKKYTIEKVIKEIGLELKSKSVMPYFFNEYDLTKNTNREEPERLRKQVIFILMRTSKGREILKEYLNEGCILLGE